MSSKKALLFHKDGVSAALGACAVWAALAGCFIMGNLYYLTRLFLEPPYDKIKQTLLNKLKRSDEHTSSEEDILC